MLIIETLSEKKKKRNFCCKVLRHRLLNKTVPFFRMELFYFSVLDAFKTSKEIDLKTTVLNLLSKCE